MFLSLSLSWSRTFIDLSSIDYAYMTAQTNQFMCLNLMVTRISKLAFQNKKIFIQSSYMRAGTTLTSEAIEDLTYYIDLVILKIKGQRFSTLHLICMGLYMSGVFAIYALTKRYN